ncbi:hypothetical protein KKG22_03400 [Patescibacteria group bacterium]|nr:hypothetical protein [Patescibacteria group bacterium]MBU1721195.1 hypothetical protein [Patescibacteria group bacterium]MBU1901097.1 hypothetical protein [Patescibacteria group bacterium]
MRCISCGKVSEGTSNICTSCGVPFPEKTIEEQAAEATPGVNKLLKKKQHLVRMLVIVFIVGMGIYNSVDDSAIDKNNEALLSLDSGNAATAIVQLEEAADEAVTKKNKINFLKNLAYAYDLEGRTEEAVAIFQKALLLTDDGDFEYYLIAGEIATLEKNIDEAVIQLEKALKLKPKDDQVNNSLSLIYLDLEEIAPQYENYVKALEYAKKAYEYDEEKSETSKQNLAIAYYFNDELEEVITLLLSTNITQHPYMGYWLGSAYAGVGDDVNAKRVLIEAIDAGMEFPQEVYDYLAEE